MNARTVLAHLPDAESAGHMLGVVRPLVAASEGHLIALHISPPMLLKLRQVITADLEGVSREERARREEAQRIRAIVEEAARGEPFVAEWRHVEAEDDPAIARAAVGIGRTADLVVACRSRPRDPFALRELPARLALECGRPLLFLPREWNRPVARASAVIAWNGSREAARAAFDALPYLRGAARVEIVTAIRDEEREDKALPGEGLAAALSRHGLKCEVASLACTGAGDAAALLEHVSRAGADLLIMGAYGRPRLSELILGGVTRTVLRECPVPVLLSH